MRAGAWQPVREKPAREELLSHYIHFVLDHDLHINTAEEVTDVQREQDEGFIIRTRCRSCHGREEENVYRARAILFAIGAMVLPRLLNIPGEGLPKVNHKLVASYHDVQKYEL